MTCNDDVVVVVVVVCTPRGRCRGDVAVDTGIDVVDAVDVVVRGSVATNVVVVVVVASAVRSSSGGARFDFFGR